MVEQGDNENRVGCTPAGKENAVVNPNLESKRQLDGLLHFSVLEQMKLQFKLHFKDIWDKNFKPMSLKLGLQIYILHLYISGLFFRGSKHEQMTLTLFVAGFSALMKIRPLVVTYLNVDLGA